ncbi:hypothetical protein [Streptomyces scabiei]|uniref:hypothetical protein n=1 Tax=Streptomyces scabiei TaxID=1930 RepID=UPI0039F6797C
MTSSIGLWLLAMWMLATVAGILVLGLAWFRTPHEEEWLPVGYVEHERVFPCPDGLLAVLLVATAGLTLTEIPVARRLAGWAIADHMRTGLVTDALSTAERTRGSLAGAVIHTDHGEPFRVRQRSQISVVTWGFVVAR